MHRIVGLQGRDVTPQWNLNGAKTGKDRRRAGESSRPRSVETYARGRSNETQSTKNMPQVYKALWDLEPKPL